MQRRQFMGLVLGGGAMLALPKLASGRPELELERSADITPLTLDEAEWRSRLSAEQFRVLREEGTERSGSSKLNSEHREGEFRCAGCDLALFTSKAKFESGTGWPSFFDHVDGHLLTKTDYGLVWPRTEYHCARCGGHQGHVFEDGPKPTGLRWCNNGVALNFVPA